MSSRRDRLDELLARGHLPGSARERILEEVLQEVGAARRWHARPIFAWCAPVVAAGAFVTVALVMRVSSPGTRAKGTPSATGARVTLECTRGDHDMCSRQGMLLFRVEGLRDRAYLAAYAQPLGGGERTWFFPSGPDSVEPILEASAEPQIGRQGVHLRSVPEGRYEVKVVLSRRPLSREEAVGTPGDGLFVDSLSLTVGQ